jgi:hypothetical protein
MLIHTGPEIYTQQIFMINEERCFKVDKKGNNLRDRMFKKNFHHISETDFQRTNSGGQFARVGNCLEHPEYGISKWPCNVYSENFYD